MTDMLPTLFISHGSPMTALEDTAAHRFLATLGTLVPRPKAVLAVSAHWETNIPAVSTTAQNTTIHDFYGFPPPLYQLHYNAPGAPDVAERTAALLHAAGMQVGADPQRGLDHGAWVPLLLAWPEADIPVTQLSVQTHLGAAHHLALGAALAPLREEGVLIMASGSYTHDLRRFRRGIDLAAPETPDVTAFSDWMHGKIMDMDFAALADYRAQAPYARDEHPTDEHLLPLHVAMGAAGTRAKAERLHSSVEFGFLRMDSYAFN
jgi:4,5-DOPA dioxygenase extradiol